MTFKIPVEYMEMQWHCSICLGKISTIVKRPTCDTGSTLDHIYVNDAMKLKGTITELDAAYYSDHDIISLYIPKEE